MLKYLRLRNKTIDGIVRGIIAELPPINSQNPEDTRFWIILKEFLAPIIGNNIIISKEGDKTEISFQPRDIPDMSIDRISGLISYLTGYQEEYYRQAEIIIKGYRGFRDYLIFSHPQINLTIEMGDEEPLNQVLQERLPGNSGNGDTGITPRNLAVFVASQYMLSRAVYAACNLLNLPLDWDYGSLDTAITNTAAWISAFYIMGIKREHTIHIPMKKYKEILDQDSVTSIFGEDIIKLFSGGATKISLSFHCRRGERLEVSLKKEQQGWLYAATYGSIHY